MKVENHKKNIKGSQLTDEAVPSEKEGPPSTVGTERV